MRDLIGILTRAVKLQSARQSNEIVTIENYDTVSASWLGWGQCLEIPESCWRFGDRLSSKRHSVWRVTLILWAPFKVLRLRLSDRDATKDFLMNREPIFCFGAISVDGKRSILDFSRRRNWGCSYCQRNWTTNKGIRLSFATLQMTCSWRRSGLSLELN
jgi:hypothetical protein